MRSLRWRAPLGMLLTACLAFLVVAVSASAADTSPIEAPNGPGQATSPEQPSPNEVKPVRELPELRTANSDTFAQADGTRLLKISLHRLNYQVNGAWQPINDRLEAGADGSSHPIASPTPVSFPASIGSGPVTVGPSGQQLSFALQGASAPSTVSGATSTYPGVMPGVNVAYATSSESVRETLTLASAAAPTTYKYDLTLSSGLKASLSRSGGVDVRDAQGKLIYWLAAPTVSDSSSAQHLPWTAPVHYELSSDGSVLSLVLSKSWLQDPSRVFPVKIDPDVYFGATQDCSIVNQGLANTSICGSTLYVGDNSESPKEVARSLLQFDLTSIPKGSEILSSNLALWFATDTSSSPLELEAFALNPNGFTHEATWNSYDGTNAWTNPGGDVLKTQAGTSLVKDEYKNGWIFIGFTPQLEQWVRDPSSNHGILLKAHDETTPAVDTFVQTENGEGAPEPTLNVIYEAKLGNPPDGAMYQMGVGGGETLGVNVANGNLHVSAPDVRYDTEGYATELTRSYNSKDDELVSSSFGHGWRSSLGEDELLYPAWWDESYALHQPDGSYTRFDRAPWADNHPSTGDKAYTGEAYVGAGLVVHENGTRTVTEPGGVEWQYDNSGDGYPQKIVDAGGEGNTISLNYTLSHLTKVADTHGHELILTRESGTHYVTKIVGKEAGETWKYAYNAEGQLTTYTNPASEKVKYTYTTSYGLLESIADAEGTWVIAYDAYGRVASIRKIVNGTINTAGSEDEITTLSYEVEKATVTTPSATTNAYYYDQFGNRLEEPQTQEAAAEFYAGYAGGIEAGTAQADVDLQDHATILDSQLSEQLGGNYVGEWFDATSGTIQIGITSEGYERTVEQDLDNLGLSDNAVIVPEANSIPQLESEQHALEGALPGLIGEGLITVGVVIEENAVQVIEGTSLTSGQKAEVVSAAAGSSVPVKIVASSYPSAAVPLASCRYASCPWPLRGGVRIGSSHVGCTAGYIARATYGGKPYVMTAGHCISKATEGDGTGAMWYAKLAEPSETEAQAKKFEPLDPIGKAHSAFYSSHREGVSTEEAGDAGLIEIAPFPEGDFQVKLSPEIITYGNSEFEEFGVVRREDYKIFGTHYNENGKKPLLHFVVCISGTEPTHGTQEAQCGMEEGFTSQGLLGNHVDNLEKLNVCIGKEGKTYLKSGASGGPVYKYGLAFGILTNIRGCEALYEGIATAQRVLHVEVLQALS
jgi:YD repeat-containing protein